MANSRGGRRKDAGRPKGSRNRANSFQKTKLSALAKEHTKTAFLTLVDVAENGTTDGSRVSAAIAILDRAFGRPREALLEQYDLEEPLREPTEEEIDAKLRELGIPLDLLLLEE